MTIHHDTGGQPTPCPKCRSTHPPKAETHTAGTTLTCTVCGHTQELDRTGRPYTHPQDQPPDPTSSTHQTTTYPLYLACVSISLLKHHMAVHLNDTYVTASNAIPVLVRVYHQPFRTPILSFRPTRAQIQPGRAYIYAAERDPYERDYFTGMTRQPRDLRVLIQKVAAEVSGLDLRSTSVPWPICPPATIINSPLAPAP